MALWDKIKAEFIDIIEWLDSSGDTMVFRFPRYQNEIKQGAKLVVREGEAAAFVNEGQLADVFTPGTYTLETKNLPILATLKGWKYGFDSPFKAEVYFVSTRQFTDLKWGTKNPILLRDPEFGPIRIRAFGTYVIRVKDVAVFLRQVVGTDHRFTAEEITDELRDAIVTQVGDAIAETKIGVLDMAANTLELGDALSKQIQPYFAQYGLELTRLRVENISVPEEVEKAMDKGTSARMVGNLDNFTRYQAADAIEKSASNPGAGGGLAAGAMGAGIGMAMGQTMSRQLQNAQQQGGQGGQSGPPPLPPTAVFYVAVNGQQTGPFDMPTLRLQAQAGKLMRESLVWRGGMADWAPAGEVGELASLFASTPPPLPGR